MPQRETIKVEGYREFLRACDRAGKETRREVRKTFRQVGDIVRQEARVNMRDLEPRSPKTEQGFRTVVRTRGVDVEQTKRKTTGKRGDWGDTQMKRALIPALEEKEDEVGEAFGEALDKVADRFDRL